MKKLFLFGDCPRCLTGTLRVEQDEFNIPYLTCLACGVELKAKSPRAIPKTA